MRNLCAVVVDMQDKFVDDVLTDQVCRMILAQKKMLKYFLKNDLPVLMFEYDPSIFGSTINDIMDIYNQFPTHRRAIVKKSTSDGMASPEAGVILDRWKISDTTLSGLNAKACVAQTGRGVRKTGRRINTARELIADGRNTAYLLNDVGAWYREQGIYRETYAELEHYLSALIAEATPANYMVSRSLEVALT